jgi:hypothetical protein
MVSGPVTDYTMVFSYIQTSPFEGAPDGGLWWWIGKGSEGQNAGQHGPFRQALLTNHDGNTWQPQDNFSRFADGLSNQLFFGEKHIPSGLVGKCCIKIWDGTHGGSIQVDCSMFLIGEERSWSSARVVYHHNLSKVDKPGIVTSDIQGNVRQFNAAFGAVHGNICNFLVGDGSVHGLSSTINVDVLANLGTVDDGNSAAIP